MNRRRVQLMIAFVCLSFAYQDGQLSASTTARTNVPVIFMVGDSTMADKPLFPAQPERGWGQLLPLYFKDEVRVKNLAKNGRSSKSFRDEGLWDTVMKVNFILVVRDWILMRPVKLFNLSEVKTNTLL